MKCLLALLMATLPAICFAEPSVLTLDRAAVLVLSTPDAEVPEGVSDDEGFAEFLDDFETYSRAIALALRRVHGVRFIASNATAVRFPHSTRPPVTRSSLLGYGFIVFVPGKAPVVFQGVATDQEVLCALQRLRPKSIAHLNCGPVQPSKHGQVARRLQPGKPL